MIDRHQADASSPAVLTNGPTAGPKKIAALSDLAQQGLVLFPLGVVDCSVEVIWRAQAPTRRLKAILEGVGAVCGVWASASAADSAGWR